MIFYVISIPFILSFHTVILHIIAILSVNKSRPGEPSILQEATFIFVLPAPSTATASEVHTTVQRVNNECIDGCDQPE